ncbi:MAG TPA: hypothetical protein VFK80_05730, partial [Limnochordia bacterium]|nr:hypothetical protein [Limnochordia bacterium]
YAPDALAVADVDLAERIGKYAELTGVPELRARLLLERRPDLYGLLTQARPPLAERYPGARLTLPARVGTGDKSGKDPS